MSLDRCSSGHPSASAQRVAWLTPGELTRGVQRPLGLWRGGSEGAAPLSATAPRAPRCPARRPKGCRPPPRPRPPQCPFQHPVGDLPFPHHRQRRAEFGEVFHRLVRIRPCQDFEARLGRACLFDDLAGLEGFGDGDEDAARAGDIRLGQHLGVGGVAGDDAGAVGRARPRRRPRRPRSPPPCARPRPGACPPARRRGHSRRRPHAPSRPGRGRAAAGPGTSPRPAGAVRPQEQQRVDQDGQDRPGQHQVAPFRRQHRQRRRRARPG